MATQETPKKAEDTVPTYEVLEEDDEFEEFADKDWDETAEDPTGTAQFEEDWDDTEIDDDFTNQLRKELSSVQKK